MQSVSLLCTSLCELCNPCLCVYYIDKNIGKYHFFPLNSLNSGVFRPFAWPSYSVCLCKHSLKDVTIATRQCLKCKVLKLVAFYLWELIHKVYIIFLDINSEMHSSPLLLFIPSVDSLLSFQRAWKLLLLLHPLLFLYVIISNWLLSLQNIIIWL